MKIEINAQQRDAQAAFRSFVEGEIVPHAGRWDQDERLPAEVIDRLRSRRYLGAPLPAAVGGTGMDMITYGLLHQEIGRGCSSVRSLLTVHDMVAHALCRWGSAEQKERWLPQLASGEVIAALGLSEPDVGSDAVGVEMAATAGHGCFLLQGRKKWISFGQIAGLFLIVARLDGEPTAFLVARETPGLSIRPITGMLGLRASMLAELQLDQCRVPRDNLVAGVGRGFTPVVATALDLGRYTVAWGCVGIAQACLDASLQYAGERRQFGAYLKDHQLIQAMLATMIANVTAARLLCLHAGSLKDSGDPGAMMETFLAKYFASTMVTRTANDAVQIHGAVGCSSEAAVQRYLRDARIMEIIEGTTQISQITIGRQGLRWMSP